PLQAVPEPQEQDPPLSSQEPALTHRKNVEDKLGQGLPEARSKVSVTACSQHGSSPPPPHLPEIQWGFWITFIEV
uniref:Uncharacterized protein n=1 Tax=Neovison vison TaxID=452646 RepID=A0A8C7BTC2_NEOVI